ncbi:hypothetical protein I79_006043 [Cricetulus griseus]|uniref:Uncharacterized protein n=1 Tax=Cricetulus griseus TaxID=10029 RepID=G3H6S4_CRIGR|nr:hypothetical protein I79_006043 [Cricetulus griseus]
MGSPAEPHCLTPMPLLHLMAPGPAPVSLKEGNLKSPKDSRFLVVHFKNPGVF